MMSSEEVLHSRTIASEIILRTKTTKCIMQVQVKKMKVTKIFCKKLLEKTYWDRMLVACTLHNFSF